MMKKNFKFLVAITAIVMAFLCFHGCSSSKSNNEYVTAIQRNSFSTLNDIVAWTDDSHFFIEKDGVVKSNLDYYIELNDPYYSNPVLIGDYLYYVGGFNVGNEQRRYIARINHTEERPKREKLTEPTFEISSYTVLENKLYYISREKLKERDKLHVKNLSDNKEEVLIDNVFVHSSYRSFSTNGDKLILGDMIFDIKTKTSQIFTERRTDLLGVINNYYYFQCTDALESEYYFMRINLNDNSIETLFSRDSYGTRMPKLYDNKILFLDRNDETPNRQYEYYDILKDEMVTVMGFDNPQQRYSYNDRESNSRYDYMIYNDYFYVHYPKLMTRMNMSTKQEEVWASFASEDIEKYEWYSYDEYVQKLENE